MLACMYVYLKMVSWLAAGLITYIHLHKFIIVLIYSIKVASNQSPRAPWPSSRRRRTRSPAGRSLCQPPRARYHSEGRHESAASGTTSRPECEYRLEIYQYFMIYVMYVCMYACMFAY